MKVRRVFVFILLAAILLGAGFVGNVQGFQTSNVSQGAVYYPDPSEVDQGLAGSGRTIKAYVDLIGATYKATIELRNLSIYAQTIYSCSTDETIPSNITLKINEGAILKVTTTKTVTVNGPFIHPEPTQCFDCVGTGTVKIDSVNWERPVEWFGAVGGDSINDYDAILNALKSCTILNGGGCVTFDSAKIYIINNGANPGIELDADSLPDSNISAPDDEQLPQYELKARGRTDRIKGDNTPSMGKLQFTGSGTGIKIHSSGGVRKWRGKVHIIGLNLDGYETADDGIYMDCANRGNIIQDVFIRRFLGNGFEAGPDNCFFNIHRNVSSIHNTGYGFKIDGEHDFHDCVSERNGDGGICIVSTASVINWFGGQIQFNRIPQIRLEGGDSVNFDHTYVEGQTKQYMAGGAAIDGFQRGIIEVEGYVHQLSISGRFVHGYIAGDDDCREQILLRCISGSIYGLKLGPAVSTISGYTHSVQGAISTYIVGDMSGLTLLRNSLYDVYYPGGLNCTEFEVTADKYLWNIVMDKNNNVWLGGQHINLGVGISGDLKWPMGLITTRSFYDLDVDPGDSGAQLLMEGNGDPQLNCFQPPWNGFISGMSVRLNTPGTTGGTITVKTTGLSGTDVSEAISVDADPKNVTFSYAGTDHTFAADDTIKATIDADGSVPANCLLSVILWVSIYPANQ